MEVVCTLAWRMYWDVCFHPRRERMEGDSGDGEGNQVQQEEEGEVSYHYHPHCSFLLLLPHVLVNSVLLYMTMKRRMAVERERDDHPTHQDGKEKERKIEQKRTEKKKSRRRRKRKQEEKTSSREE